LEIALGSFGIKPERVFQHSHQTSVAAGLAGEERSRRPTAADGRIGS
jgi:hypothetical protein